MTERNYSDSSGAAKAAWMEIDARALAQNFAAASALLEPGTRTIASVKADAYGHGILPCARALLAAGADMLATGDFDEAVGLREAGIEAPILMFGGSLPAELPRYITHDLIPTVYDLPGCEALSAAASRETCVYLKVDCGLGRLGVACDDAFEFVKQIAALENISVAGVYTHVPYHDAASRSQSKLGLARFDALLSALRRDGLEIPVSQARASAAVLDGLRDGSNAVCIGHLYYGLSPVAPGEADMSAFKPVMRAVRGRLIHVATHPSGSSVAIGGYSRLANAMRTGVVPMGMAQGMRMAKADRNQTALLRGQRVRVLSISLEHATLDLSNIDEPRLGEVVTFLGESDGDAVSIEEIAASRGCSPLEVTMTFSRRLNSVVVGDES